MKLIYYIILRITLALTFILTVWAIFFYVTMIDEVNDEVDDALEDYSETIIIRALAGEKLPSKTNGSNNQYYMMEVSKEYAESREDIQYKDSMVYIEEKEETEPARILTTIFKDDEGRYHELTVSTPSIEKDDLRDAIQVWIIFLYVALLFCIIIISVWVFYRNMRPLYVLLHWLDGYQTGKKNKPLSNETQITEFRKLNEAAIRYVERTEQMFEQQKQFIGNASHEIQTPLAICRNRLEMLMEDDSLSEKQLEELMKTHQTLEYITKLNKSLLLLTKIDNGQFTDTKQLELNGLLKQYLQDYEEVYDYRNIEVTIDEQDIFNVTINESLAVALLTNLLKNAFVHNIDGGHIRITVTKNSITFRNSGVKNPLDKEHIFERFYSESGVGIGLSLTKSLVELHKGTILFKSTEGEGTVFQVFIPFQNKNTLIEPLSETTTFSQEDSGPFTASEYIHPEIEDRDRDMSDKPALLIVDDNKGIVQILDELFCPYYKILTAFNGKEAFDLCLSQIPSLVISDIYMPEMNGIELCSAIKSTKETSHIPVILLTAKTSKEIQQEGLSVYADAYCSKPFDNDILISTVHSILTNRQMLAQKFSNNLMSEEDPTTVFPEKTDRDFIQKIIKVVEDNIANEELSVSLLCRTIGMSQLTLNKKIKQLTNQTTNAFIRSIRLKVASQMILSQKYSISEVTYAVGFSDLRYFRECFKKEFGVLPSDYKK